MAQGLIEPRDHLPAKPLGWGGVRQAELQVSPRAHFFDIEDINAPGAAQGNLVSTS